jgi:hypothetical protein
MTFPRVDVVFEVADEVLALALVEKDMSCISLLYPKVYFVPISHGTMLRVKNRNCCRNTEKYCCQERYFTESLTPPPTPSLKLRLTWEIEPCKFLASILKDLWSNSVGSSSLVYCAANGQPPAVWHKPRRSRAKRADF